MSEVVEFGPDEPDFELPPSLLEAQADPNGAAAWAARAVPGLASVGALSVLDPARLSGAGHVDALVGLEKIASWVAGMQNRVMAALVGDYAAEGIWNDRERQELVELEVSAALRLSA